MRILKVTIQNVKRLVGTVEIVPTTDVVELVGKNDQGKTTFLQALRWVFEGSKVVQGEPISRGQNSARVRLELGDGKVVELIATLSLTKKGRSLSFKNANGSPQNLSAQEMADTLRGAIAFDPLAFDRMKPRAQYDLLRSIANLGVDIEELDRLNAADYALRTDVNREAKKASAAAELIEAGEVCDLIDTTAILDEIEAAGAKNKKLLERAAKRREFDAGTEKLIAEAVDWRKKATEWHKMADEAEQGATAIEADVRRRSDLSDGAEPVPDPIDVSGLRQRLDGAVAANKATEARIADGERRRKLFAEAATLTDQSDALTAAMEAREQQKRDAIESAKLPVAGLGFGDGIVTYDGLPFEQAGTAKRIEVCCAIAMAQNPTLKVICIEDAGLLVGEGRAIIDRMAEEKGYQYFLEVAADTDDPEFVIEDGMFVIENGAVKKEKP